MCIQRPPLTVLCPLSLCILFIPFHIIYLYFFLFTNEGVYACVQGEFHKCFSCPLSSNHILFTHQTLNMRPVCILVLMVAVLLMATVDVGAQFGGGGEGGGGRLAKSNPRVRRSSSAKEETISQDHGDNRGFVGRGRRSVKAE